MPERVTTQMLLSRALGLQEADIVDGLTLESCSSWDSLAHLRVVLALEAELGRPLEPDEIFSIGGVADVEKILACAE